MTGGSINIGQLLATIGGDVEPLRESMAEAEREVKRANQAMADSTQRFNDSMKRAGKQVQAVGRSLTKYVTLPMAAVGVGAFKMQKDFESSMSKIVGLVGVAQDQVDAWAKDITAMAPEVAKAPQELADALFFVTSAGFRGAEAMDVLEVSAKAASAGLGETKVVADLVTSAINAYGIENLDAAQATDILTGAVREGKAEAEELASSMGQVLPIASELGVSFDEVGAAQAAMTRTGTDAATAATQLRQILMSMMKVTPQAERALNEMGTSSEELREKLGRDGLWSVLTDLRNRTEQYGKSMVDIFPNVRAVAGVLDLVGENAEDNAKIFKSLTDATGSLDNAFDAASKTAEFQWQAALAAGQATLVELGEVVSRAFLPILQKATEVLQSITKWFSNLTESQKTWVLAIGVTATALGPLLVTMGFMMTTVIPGLTTAFVGLRVAVSKLNLVLRANPLGAFVGIVAAATAAIWGYQRAFNSVSDTQKALNNIQDTVNDQFDSQAAKIERLTRVAENGNLPLHARRDAIKELNRIVPDYNAHLTDTGELIGHNTKALDAYLKRLKEQIMLSAYQDEMTEAIKRQRDAQRALEKAQDEMMTTQMRSHGAMERMNHTMDNTNYRMRQGQYEVRKAREELEAAEKVVGDLEKEMGEYLETMITVNEQTEEGVQPQKEDNEQKKKGTQVVQDYTSALRELAQAQLQASMAANFAEAEEMLGGMNDALVGAESGLHSYSIVQQRYLEGLEQARVRNELFGESFDLVGAQIRATRQAIDELIEMGFDEMDPKIQHLMSQLEDLQAETTEWGNIATQAADSVGRAFMQMAMSGASSTSDILKQLLAQVTGYLIKEYIAKLGLFGIPLAAGAGLVAGKLFQQIPDFADGGLLFGETILRGGEYQGARTNPEVIAPLDKLKGMLGGSGGGQNELKTRLERDYMEIWLEDGRTRAHRNY